MYINKIKYVLNFILFVYTYTLGFYGFIGFYSIYISVCVCAFVCCTMEGGSVR